MAGSEEVVVEEATAWVVVVTGRPRTAAAAAATVSTICPQIRFYTYCSQATVRDRCKEEATGALEVLVDRVPTAATWVPAAIRVVLLREVPRVVIDAPQ